MIVLKISGLERYYYSFYDEINIKEIEILVLFFLLEMFFNIVKDLIFIFTLY